MIRGSVRECAPRRIESTWNANIHNRFDIEVRDAKTNQLKQKAQAFNVICKGLWEHLSNGYFNYIGYGDGTGTPSSNDTTLFGTYGLASAKDHDSGVDIESGVAYRTRKIVLDETTANGMSITEVGISFGATLSNNYNHLCTHAMLEDMNGNRISIKKTSTDILTIYATVYVHWNPSGQNGVTLSPPNLASDSYGKNFLNAALGWVFSTTSAQYAGSKSICLWAGRGTLREMTTLSDNGTTSMNTSTKKWTYTFARAGVGNFNVPGGFGWLSFHYPHTSGMNYCVVDVRDDYEVLNEAVGTGDGSTTSFVTKFDMPANAKVYVNGLEVVSGVTVQPHPVSTDATLYMIGIQDKLYDNKPCFTMPGYNAPVGATYVYNPLHDLGVGKFASSSYSSYWRFAFSDDFENWSPDYSTGTTIPEAYRHCKYIRLTNNYTSTLLFSYLSATFASASGVSSKNIIFDEAPAEGSVITIDYTTPFVPKDENGVYDLTIAIQFGEYTK